MRDDDSGHPLGFFIGLRNAAIIMAALGSVALAALILS